MKKMNTIHISVNIYKNMKNLCKMHIFSIGVLEKVHKNIPWMNGLYNKHEFYTLYFKLYNRDKDI